MVSVVAGMMLAKRFKGETGRVGVACIGDGTTSVGATHEAVNLIAVEKLPVVIVVTNNQFAYSTPNSQEFATSLMDRGRGYGLGCHECDGTDFMATLTTMQHAISAARAGEGPQWVVANTLRMCGHGEHDDAAYIPEELKAAYADRDPLAVARHQMLETGWLTEAEAQAWDDECRDEVQRLVAQAQREKTPNPADEDWMATSWNPEY
jgi:TPP-dependent pyruvate/acetoin dehydrogenase alpha subunit